MSNVNTSKIDRCNIVHHGQDGFGHQLYGLFTSLILHEVGDFYFDGAYFVNKKFSFQHLSDEEATRARDYLVEAVSHFVVLNKQVEIDYSVQRKVGGCQIIPKEYDPSVLYLVDNAYSFEQMKFTATQKNRHNCNILQYKRFFCNDLLPSPRLEENSIVVHVRLGDALTTGRGKSINAYNRQVRQVLKLLKTRYPGSGIYVHSDGDPNFLSDIPHIFFGKDEGILQTISDFINANILVTGHSGLSKVCAFLGNHDLILTHDDNLHGMPESVVKVSQLLSGAVDLKQ